MDWITNPDIWTAFLTLCALEIVLGVDNLIFISILANKLPEEQQAKARLIGLSLALVARIILLFSITWIMGLTKDLFTVMEVGISGRDLILIVGGLFLLYKAVKEIHEKVENHEATPNMTKAAKLGTVVFQILLIDIVFSFDSVITAVGMADNLGVMIAAVVVAIVIMILAAGKLSDFVNRNPTIKILALSFLMLIGVSLMAEGLDFHIPKGYIYFAMAFAAVVEMINMRTGSRKTAKNAK